METKKVKTKLGYINGRDAIHLDKVIHDIGTLQLTFEGEIVGALCSLPQPEEWIGYCLVFEYVDSYKCTPLEDFNENLTISSFDMIVSNSNSEWIDFVLSTYDHVYEIKAREFELQVKGGKASKNQ